MKTIVSIISSTIIGLAVTIIAAGLTSCSKIDDPDTPVPSSGPNIGTYLWGEELYPMGADGAKTLAEMYSKTNIKTLYLLVKGTNGRVGFLANPAGEYEPARKDRDLLQEVTTAMHDKNIKVYAWIYASEDSCYAKKFPAEACHHFRNNSTQYRTAFVLFRDRCQQLRILLQLHYPRLKDNEIRCLNMELHRQRV